MRLPLKLHGGIYSRRDRWRGHIRFKRFVELERKRERAIADVRYRARRWNEKEQRYLFRALLRTDISYVALAAAV